MLGETAIYIAKELAKLDLPKYKDDDQINMIQDNRILVDLFYLSLSDIDCMFHRFVGGDSGLNLWGWKTKFDSMVMIASDLKRWASGHFTFKTIITGHCQTNFNLIAEDLEIICKILDHEIEFNTETIADSRDKRYNTMKDKTRGFVLV